MSEFESTEELIKALGGEGVLPEEGAERQICAVALLIMAAKKGLIELGKGEVLEEKYVPPQGYTVEEVTEIGAGMTVRLRLIRE